MGKDYFVKSEDVLELRKILEDLSSSALVGGKITITLEAFGKYEFDEVQGGEEGGSALIIPKGADVTVDGNCACLSRKANVRPFRFFHVKEDAACHLRNLRMENGMIVRAFGGAVLNEGLTTLQGCLLKGCSALGADGGKPSLAPSWDGSEWPDLVPDDFWQTFGGGGGQGGLGGALFSAGDLSLSNCCLELCSARGGEGGSELADTKEGAGEENEKDYLHGLTPPGYGGGYTGEQESSLCHKSRSACLSFGGGGGEAGKIGVFRGGQGGLAGGCGGYDPRQIVTTRRAGSGGFKPATFGGRGDSKFGNGNGGGGGALGGAVFICSGTITVDCCSFIGNSCIAGGPGAVYSSGVAAHELPPDNRAAFGKALGSCIFTMNVVPIIDNCTYAGNFTVVGHHVHDQDVPLRKNCSFYENDMPLPICRRFTHKFAEATSLPLALVDVIFRDYCRCTDAIKVVGWRKSEQVHTYGIRKFVQRECDCEPSINGHFDEQSFLMLDCTIDDGPSEDFDWERIVRMDFDKDSLPESFTAGSTDEYERSLDYSVNESLGSWGPGSTNDYVWSSDYGATSEDEDALNERDHGSHHSRADDDIPPPCDEWTPHCDWEADMVLEALGLELDVRGADNVLPSGESDLEELDFELLEALRIGSDEREADNTLPSRTFDHGWEGEEVNGRPDEGEGESVVQRREIDYGWEEGESGVEPEEGESNVEPEEGESDVEPEEGESDIESEEGESDIESEEGESEIELEEGESDVESEEGESDVESEEGESDIELEEGESDIEAEKGGSDIEAEEGESDIESEEGKSDIESEERESDVKAEEGESDVELEEGESDVEPEEGESDVETEEGECDVEPEEGEFGVEPEEDEFDVEPEDLTL